MNPKPSTQTTRRKRVYISGPMSGMAYHLWRARFDIKAEQLRAQGYDVVNPARFAMARWTWLYKLVGYRLTILYDLWRLSKCDAICTLPEWERSRGSRIEVQWAQEFCIETINL